MMGVDLFGTYTHRDTLIHRTPLWFKGVTLLVLSCALVATETWVLGGVALGVIILLGLAAGITPKQWLRSLLGLTWLIIILAAYYVFFGNIAQGADVLLTLMCMVAFSKVLLTTTPLPRIIDGFVSLCTPLKIFGIKPERIAIAIAVMIRSIPVIMNEHTMISHALISRGVKVAPHRTFTPLIISTVAYAHETGDALAARGLMDAQVSQKPSSSQNS